MKIVIVIPTYNEAENIGRLIEVLDDEFHKDPINVYSVLVVEGNSPDNTAGVVREKAEKYRFVNLLMEEKKAGLGAAYVYGFRYAMTELNPDVIVEMDADFQHDPKDVSRLVKEINDGNDYVIGSRFTRGGSIPKEWKLHRKLLSYWGNMFSKIVLGIYNVKDFTSGFKASRVKGFVDKIDLGSVLSDGFAYKIDLLFKMHRLGAKIKEIPIKFGLRDRGDSKMERNNLSDSLRVVLTLRFNENKNFFKFCIVGFAGLTVDAGLFNILRVTALPSNISAIVSGFVAMVTTFLLNNYWSFKERKLKGGANKLVSLVVYVISSLIPIFVRSQLVRIATTAYGDTLLVSNTAFFIGIVLGLIWNFTVYSKLIWREKKN
jgi:dolichol-phosphate mannosyltransferase